MNRRQYALIVRLTATDEADKTDLDALFAELYAEIRSKYGPYLRGRRGAVQVDIVAADLEVRPASDWLER